MLWERPRGAHAVGCCAADCFGGKAIRPVALVVVECRGPLGLPNHYIPAQALVLTRTRLPTGALLSGRPASPTRWSSTGTLAGHWQAAAILAPPGSRPFRCRELVQASLGAAFAKAAAELRAWRVQLQGAGAGSGGAGGAGGGGGEVEAAAPAAAPAAPHPGVIVVTGSLHAVAEAHKLPELAPLLMG